MDESLVEIDEKMQKIENATLWSWNGNSSQMNLSDHDHNIVF